MVCHIDYVFDGLLFHYYDFPCRIAVGFVGAAELQCAADGDGGKYPEEFQFLHNLANSRLFKNHSHSERCEMRSLVAFFFFNFLFCIGV